METFEFNKVIKWYHNDIIIIQQKIVKEQWYRWQLHKICEILELPIKDSLSIEYSNEQLVDSINNLKRINEVKYISSIKKFKTENPDLLNKLGLELIDDSIPITNIEITKNNLFDINEKKMFDTWSKWQETKTYEYEEKDDEIVLEEFLDFDELDLSSED